MCASHATGALGGPSSKGLARGAIEGLERVRSGLKPATEWRPADTRGIRVEFDKEGPFHGAPAHYVVDPTSNTLAVAASRSIGLGKNPTGPFTWFDPEAVPPNSALPDAGYEKGELVYFRVVGLSLEEASPYLVAKGYKTSDATELPLPAGALKTTATAMVGTSEFRAVAKMAFNYLAYVAGSGFVLQPDFNEVRAFVLRGAESDSPIVTPGDAVETVTPERRIVTGHYIAVRAVGSRVLGQVSLFGRTRYFVVLSDAPRLIPIHLSKCHVFDLERRSVTEASAPPF